MIDLSTATIDLFEPHVGSSFALDHPDHREAFTLVDAVPVKSHDHPLKIRDPFSLFFNGLSTQQQFNQQILPLKHLVLGSLQLFMVPVARNRDGTIHYQALFN